MPVLKDATQTVRRPLHWRMNRRGQEAVRNGDWKTLKVAGNEYLCSTFQLWPQAP